MPRFKVYRTTFLEDDIVDGEITGSDTVEEIEDCAPDDFDVEEGVSAVDKAADFLNGERITQPSCSPYPRTGTMAGIWFSHIDGSYISNYYTGEKTEVSAHPEGFTDDELRAICEQTGAR